MRNYYNSFGFRISSDSKTQVGNQAIPRPSTNLSSTKSLWMFMLMILAFTAGNQKMLAQASSANYSFTSSATGSLVDMSSGTIQILAPGVDDTSSALTNFNLGAGSTFEFYFMGTRYTQFGVSDNGILTLGATPGTAVYAIPNTTVPTLAPFGNDMRIATNGKVEAKVLGTAPNRTLVVQWTNVMVRYLNPAIAGGATFQVRLYENSGAVEYAYGAMPTNTASPTVYYVGFSSNTTSTNLVTVNTATNTASTVTPAVSNTYLASATVLDLNSTADGSRKVYTFTPPGSAGNVVATTLAPPTTLTFSSVNAAGMTLDWAAAAPVTGILKYAVYNSTDGGITYNYVNTTNVGTNTLAVTGLVPSTTYSWKVISISEGGKSTELLATQSTIAAGNITAVATGNWSDTATWGGAIPTATDNVTIPAGITVTEDVTAAVAYSLTISGNLVYTATTARVLTVARNVTINTGGTFKSAATGTVTTHSLVVGGDLVNNGTIDFNAFTTSGATITFNTVGNANFTLGTSSVTNLRNTSGVTLNKGSISSVLTFSPGGTLTVQGANALGFLTITSGLFKLDGTTTFSNPLFSANSYTIAAAGGFWLNNPNATIIALGGSPTFAGLFRISNGTYNVGTSTGNSVGFSTGSTTIIEGGVINAASRFGVGTAGNAISYTQSGGILTLNTLGNTSTTLASWDLGTSAASTVNISGGTVYIQNASTAASGPRDVRGTTAVAPVFTGGTLQFGNAATATNFVFRMQGQIPANVVVDNTTNPKTLQLVTTATNTIYGNLTIAVGSTFDPNALTAQILGASVVNNGAIVGTLAGSRFDFVGSIPQTYSGTGTFGTNAVPFQGTGVGISNPSNVTLSAPIITNRVNLFSGSFINSNQITIGNGTAVAVVQRGGSAGIAGSFDVAPTFNLLTNQISLLYNTSTAQITTGVEIPSTRLASFVSVNNATGVVLAGGNLDTAALTLTLGVVNTNASNVLSLSGTLATSLVGGSATSYINGPFNRAIASGNASTNYVLFPVGKAVYAPISLAPTTTSLATFKAEAFDSNTGTASPSIVNLNANRRWEAPSVTGTFTDLKVKIGDAGLVNTNIPVHASTAAGSYAASFGSTAVFATGTPNTVESSLAITEADYDGFISYATSNACVGTPTPGNTIASSTSICFGSSVTLSLATATPGTGVTYAWESSTDGTTYTPIAGATSATYLATPTVPTFYKANVVCSGSTGTSLPVQVTFANSISAPQPGSRCGTGTVVLGATANAGATVNWYSAATGGNLVGTGASFTTPSIAATTSFFASAESATTGSVTTGTGTTLTLATEQPTAFCNRWANYTSQTIYTAAELNSFGLRAGNITSMAYEITTLGDGATNPSFTVKIGNTTQSSFANTNFLTTPSTTVYGPSTYTHTASGWQVITFATPYLWDGISNIVVNVSHTGADATNNARTYYTATTDDKVLWSTTGATPTTGTVSKNRLNVLFSGQVVCGSARTEVVATVTPAPTLTLSAATASVCLGQTSSAITATAGATDFTDFVWTPNTGVSGNQTTGWVFNPTVTTTYTLNATQSGGALCAATATVVVTVNPIPTVNVLPATGSICAGSIQALNVEQATATFGTGTTVLGATAFPNSLSAYYGGVKHQILYTAAELSAQGLAAGSKISALTFDLNAFNATASLVNFTIRMGTTTNTALTGMVSGTSAVYGPTTFTATAAGITSFQFTTPYTWDGVSNLIVETVHNAGNGGNGSGNITKTTTTINNSVYYGASDNITGGIAGFDAVTVYGTSGASTARPNITFKYTMNTVWTPATGLYSDALATVAYTGESLSTVYAKPAGTTTYTATVMSGSGCSASSSSLLTVTPVVTPNFAAIAPFCAGSTAPVLATTSPNGVTGTWSPATIDNMTGGSYVFTPTAGLCANTQTLTVTVTPVVTPNFAAIAPFCAGSTAPVLATTSPNGVTGTWSPATVSNTADGTYVFTPTAGLCANTQTLSVTVTPVVTPNFAAITPLCAGSTAPVLATTSPNGVTGTWSPATIDNMTGGSYVFTPTAGLCANTQTLTVTVTPVVTPNFAAIAPFCAGSTAPVLATTSPNGVTGTWSPATIDNMTGGSYVFTPTAGLCANTQTLTVTVTPVVTPNFAAIAPFCAGSTAPTLATTSPNGVTGTWSPATINNMTGGSYVFTPTAGLCANTQTLTVTVTPSPSQPTGAASQYGATLANLVVSPSTGILWYGNAGDAVTGNNALPLTTPTVDNATYYAVQVVGTCRSTALAVTIDFDLSAPSFAANQLKYYPNPVNDVLKVSYSENISELKLYNLLGQQVLTKKVNANETQIDMSNLAAGTYMLEVSSGSNSKVVKLIKK